MKSANKQEILRATGILGGATVAGILISLVRNKVVAALVGPQGIGLLGSLTSLVALGTAVLGLGIGTSGVRQLSILRDRPEQVSAPRHALWILTGICAAAALIAFVIGASFISNSAFGNSDYSHWVAWLGIGVALTIVSAMQLAEIQSDQRMGDLARARIWAALLASVATVASVYWLGFRGLLVAAIAGPAAQCATAVLYRRDQAKPRPPSTPFSLSLVKDEMKTVLHLGGAITIAAAFGAFTQTASRSLIIQKVDLGAAGLYQASFAISALNLTIILAAMAPDYYPRVVKVIDDQDAGNKVMNDQVHVSLLLAGPVLIGVATAAPILLTLLYSSKFTGAALLLRAQLAADTLRIAGWALGFILLARKASAAYVLVEAIHAVVFIPLTWLLLSRFGIGVAGFTFFLGYFASLLFAMAACDRAGFRLDRARIQSLALLTLALMLIAVISIWSDVGAMAAGALMFVVAAVHSIREIRTIGVPLPPVVQRLVARMRKA